jgi:NADPH:quinone reductase-like Zn-dependent oxidoreductase
MEKFGGPEVLVVVDGPELKAGEDQVLVAVEACGVGLVDVIVRSGQYPGIVPAEHSLGIEAAGRVIAGSSHWVGKRVFVKANSGGCYAEQVVANVKDICEIPEGLSAEEAVALGINGLVGYFSLQRERFNAGEVVLVRGAGGGIGVMAVQLALVSGVRVIASSRSEDKRRRLAEIGVLEFDDNMQEVDGVIDPVAGEGVVDFISRLKANGRYVMNGVAGGFPPAAFGMSLLQAYQRSLSISFLSLDSIREEEIVAAMEAIFKLAIEKKIVPVIDSVYALAEVAKAHERLESGEVFGKVVLKV